MAVALGPTAAPTTWRTLVPEGEDVIEALPAVAGGSLLVTRPGEPSAACTATTHDGRALGEVALPELGSFAGFDARPRPSAGVLPAGVFTRPGALFRWTPDAGLEPWAGAGDADGAPAADPSAVTVRQVRYPSLDGTEIGLFLVHRADVAPDADTPAILNGYGGFAIASRRRGRRASPPGASGAASMPSPVCGAVTRRARTGTGRDAASTSSACSTTSPPPPTTSWPAA